MQSRKEQIEKDRRATLKPLNDEKRNSLYFLSFASLLLCVLALIFFFSSCGSKPTDMRLLVPADALVCLETNDLAGALQPIIDSKPFNEAAKSKPDLSALKGVQLAVAVTGFETSEEKLTDEQSIGRIQPHFVAIADTHAWNFQAVGFAEKKLGSFVENIYDSTPTLDTTTKNGGKYFTWTAKDNRKAYALVIDSLIFFANDETAIDKCMAVRRGEADSIIKTGKIPQAERKTLASGYVSTDGVAQIANILGLKVASESSEDSEIQSTLADFVPQLIRNTVTDVSWTFTASSNTSSPSGKEYSSSNDKFVIGLNPDVSNFLNHMPISAEGTAPDIRLLPHDAPVATYYNFADVRTAWLNLVSIIARQGNTTLTPLVEKFAHLTLASYGIGDPDMFLSGCNKDILTANLTEDSEEPLFIAEIKDIQKVKAGLATDLQPDKTLSDKWGCEVLTSEEDNLTAAFVENWIVVGDTKAVMKAIRENKSGYDGKLSPFSSFGAFPIRPVQTIGSDRISAGNIAEILSEKKSEDVRSAAHYSVNTFITATGIERKTTSDFGLIGSIIAQMKSDE